VQRRAPVRQRFGDGGRAGSASFESCYPPTELRALGTQIRRAAVSIPANIAEGHGREHLGDYLRYLSIANGSLMELETLALAAARLGMAERNQLESLLESTAETGRMLSGLVRSLRRRLPHSRHPSPDTP